jgi:hypothetical protein
MRARYDSQKLRKRICGVLPDFFASKILILFGVSDGFDFDTETQRLRERQGQRRFFCYGEKTTTEKAEKQRTARVFLVVSSARSAFSVVVTKKNFAVAVL